MINSASVVGKRVTQHDFDVTPNRQNKKIKINVKQNLLTLGESAFKFRPIRFESVEDDIFGEIISFIETQIRSFLSEHGRRSSFISFVKHKTSLKRLFVHGHPLKRHYFFLCQILAQQNRKMLLLSESIRIYSKYLLCSLCSLML